jgi:O-acetyl-ADP-ribose deacetylase (regulator of RNase III)
VWHGGTNDERTKLGNCYQNALQLAVENGCKTVAFPNISTGVYGYPKQEAAEIALKTTIEFIANHDFEKIIFCCFDEENYQIMKNSYNN